MRMLFEVCFDVKRKQSLLDFLKVALSYEKDVIVHALNYQRLLEGEYVKDHCGETCHMQ